MVCTQYYFSRSPCVRNLRDRHGYSLNADWERIQRFTKVFLSWFFVSALHLLCCAPIWFVVMILGIRHDDLLDHLYREIGRHFRSQRIYAARPISFRWVCPIVVQPKWPIVYHRTGYNMVRDGGINESPHCRSHRCWDGRWWVSSIFEPSLNLFLYLTSWIGF